MDRKGCSKDSKFQNRDVQGLSRFFPCPLEHRPKPKGLHVTPTSFKTRSLWKKKLTSLRTYVRRHTHTHTQPTQERSGGKKVCVHMGEISRAPQLPGFDCLDDDVNAARFAIGTSMPTGAHVMPRDFASELLRTRFRRGGGGGGGGRRDWCSVT